MPPTFNELIAKAPSSPWQLKFGYTLLAVVGYEDTDYVVGKNDWFDGKGKEMHGELGPMTLWEVLDQGFSEILIEKIKQVEESRPLDAYCFFVFGLNALFALLAEGLVRGTLQEGANEIFCGIIILDDKEYAFSAIESLRPAENQDFLLVDGNQKPPIIL